MSDSSPMGGGVTERELIHQRARAFFEELWQRGDPWQLETSEFDQERYDRLLAVLDGRRYGRVLEIGCGAGTFTRLVSRLAERVVALDISPAAIERARASGTAAGGLDFQVADIMNYDLEADGPWDLVIMSETIYLLGWLHGFADVGWLAYRLLASTADGGRLLLANSQGSVDEGLMQPWLIRTYRDLFANVGYRLEAEETFRGRKHGVEFAVLISLFAKPGPAG